jgi:trehalose-phosphatase
MSARPVGFLHEAVAVDGVRFVGQYGAERLVGDAAMIDERMVPYVVPLQQVAEAAEAALPGLLVERKGLGVTLHWRTDPHRAGEATAVGHMLAERHGLEAASGRMALELRPPIAIDKGGALELEVEGASHVMCAGDDRSDLAMFDALDRLAANNSLDAVRVAVRSIEGPPELVARGDIVVDGPVAVAALLADLAASAGV